MQKEMQEAADAGFRFGDVMGGDTAFGGSEAVVIMEKDATAGKYSNHLLATNKTSTMQKEMQEAGDEGFEYRGQTVFKSTFGGKEVIAILERENDGKIKPKFEYRLLASKKTSTMQKELLEAGDQGFGFVGMTVAKTLVGGDEVVSILRRRVQSDSESRASACLSVVMRSSDAAVRQAPASARKNLACSGTRSPGR